VPDPEGETIEQQQPTGAGDPGAAERIAALSTAILRVNAS